MARAKNILEKLLEAEQPSEGPFYFLRCKQGWKLYPYLYTQRGDTKDHVNIWPLAAKVVADSYVAVTEATAEEVKALADKFKAFQKSRPQNPVASAIYKQIKDLPYGFPRGRVSLSSDNVYSVRTGDDWKVTGITKSQIETAFNIRGVCEWEFDEHERCLTEEREAIRQILKIRETWPAFTE